MNAYELFCGDLKGDELTRTDADRRTYYIALRDMLRKELAAGAPCEMIRHYGRRLQAGAPGYMYLLDAAALWECYDAVVEGLRFPRDIGLGMPFPISGGKRLSWREVQKQSDMRALPVAVVDEELRARLVALVAYEKTPVEKRKALHLPKVNVRACPATADARKAPPPPGEDDAAETARLQAQLEEQKKEIARLTADCDALQRKVETLEKRPRVPVGEDELSELILNKHTAAALELARSIGSRLQEALQQQADAERTVAELQEQLRTATEQLQADVTQAAALRTRQETAQREAAQARQECEQARTEAEEAQKQLSQERQQLSEQNARLREAQHQLDRLTAARKTTTLQADAVSAAADRLS